MARFILIFCSRIKSAGAIVLLGALAGCSFLPSFGPKPSPQELVFFLDPQIPTALSSTPLCGDIQVEEPVSAPGFVGARMMYTTEPLKINSYAYARWADSVSRLMSVPIRRGLLASGQFDHVISAPTMSKTNYRLELTELSVLQSFTDPGAQTSQVTVNLNARLYDSESLVLIDTKRFELGEQALPSPTGGASTANAVVGNLIQQLNIWVGSHCTGNSQ